MTDPLEITVEEYYRIKLFYYETIGDFPNRNLMPSFERFLSPANYDFLDSTDSTNKWILGSFSLASITAQKRWHALNSPHAVTLLKMYATRYHKDPKDEVSGMV